MVVHLSQVSFTRRNCGCSLARSITRRTSLASAMPAAAARADSRSSVSLSLACPLRAPLLKTLLGRTQKMNAAGDDVITEHAVDRHVSGTKGLAAQIAAVTLVVRVHNNRS